MKKGLGFIFFVWTMVGHAQMLEEGEGVVEFDLGYPNLKPMFYNPASILHSGLGESQSDAHAYGQFILKGEFMVSDRIGVAASFNYGYFTSYDVAQGTEWNSSTQAYESYSYFYDSRIHKLRLMFGMNFHLLQTNRADTYFGFQAGTKKTYLSYETNDPAVTEAPDAWVFPYAFRVHYGIRYFFTEYLAANAELGFGGPTISMGLTYKF